jgi:hypothetical protein
VKVLTGAREAVNVCVAFCLSLAEYMLSSVKSLATLMKKCRNMVSGVESFIILGGWDFYVLLLLKIPING